MPTLPSMETGIIVSTTLLLFISLYVSANRTTFKLSSDQSESIISGQHSYAKLNFDYDIISKKIIQLFSKIMDSDRLKFITW